MPQQNPFDYDPGFLGRGINALFGPPPAIAMARAEHDIRQRAGQAGARGLSMLAERLQGAGVDMMSQRNALLQTVRDISDDPSLVADNPDLLPELLEHAKRLQGPEPFAASPGTQILQQGAGGGIEVMHEVPTSGAQMSAFEEKRQAYRGLGLSEQEATERALGEHELRQVTDPFTRQSFPIMVDKLRGTAFALGGPGAGTQLTAEQTQVLIESGAAGPAVEATSILNQIEQQTAAEAVVETGAVPSIGRAIGTLLAPISPEAQPQSLLTAQTTINDLKADISSYTRDMADTARLAGITEISRFDNLAPDTNFWTSPKENVTRLIRLRDRLDSEQKIAREFVATQSTSPEMQKQLEGWRLTGQRMLEKIGTREELEQVLAHVSQNPAGLGQVVDQIRTGLGRAPEELARAGQELSRVGTPVTEGLPPEVFEQILSRDLTGPDPVSEEEYARLSREQKQQLLQAIEGARSGQP